MENKIKRPISVWIAQILLGIATLPFAFLMLFRIISIVSDLRVYGFVSTIGTFLITLLFSLIFGLPLLGAIKGMAKRRAYGRWLGVGMLSLMFVFFLLSQIFRPTDPTKYYEYSNTAQAVGGLIAQFIFFGLFLLLIVRLAFAKKVSAFFANSEAQTSTDPPPPPPPTFDD